MHKCPVHSQSTSCSADDFDKGTAEQAKDSSGANHATEDIWCYDTSGEVEGGVEWWKLSRRVGSGRGKKGSENREASLSGTPSRTDHVDGPRCRASADSGCLARRVPL